MNDNLTIGDDITVGLSTSGKLVIQIEGQFGIARISLEKDWALRFLTNLTILVPKMPEPIA